MRNRPAGDRGARSGGNFHHPTCSTELGSRPACPILHLELLNVLPDLIHEAPLFHGIAGKVRVHEQILVLWERAKA